MPLDADILSISQSSWLQRVLLPLGVVCRLQTEIRALSQLQTRLQEKRLELVLQQHRDQEQALMRRRLEKENEA